MRSCLLLCVLLLWIPGFPAKKIEAGGFAYVLEQVLKLQNFLHKDGKDLEVAASEACHDPHLPHEFQPVCSEAEAPEIFVQLVRAAMDECEVCANAACPGC
ncbi:guanylate cyclase activator 2B [Leptodactylus fuscus]|uniref:guanylate cyclase activator 2B n=1 Tax=Leptodactylus fuscus TaxID=238119 RepID=UPI003F4E8A1D